MSLQPHPIDPIPEQTILIARAAFPKGNPLMRMRDELGTIYEDHLFAALFPQRGQPAEAPWRLALVTVMQFAEGLTDRQAAEAVQGRLDWKYALGLELTDSGFDFSVLSKFRSRLLQGKAEEQLLSVMLERFKSKGLLKPGGRARTDSTHVLAAIRLLHRLESVGETLRAALNDLATVVPDWLREQAEVERLQIQRQRIEKEEKRLLDAYQAEVISLEELRDRRQHLSGRRQVLESQQQAQERHLAQISQHQQVLTDLRQFSEQIRTRLAEASFEEKQKILQLVIERIIVGEEVLEIRHIIPLHQSAEGSLILRVGEKGELGPPGPGLRPLCSDGMHDAPLAWGLWENLF